PRPPVRGAFSSVYLAGPTLPAVRDPPGGRLLALGRLVYGGVAASDTAALHIPGAKFVRDVDPGELIAIDEDGLRSHRFAEPEHARCVFEYVYLARPDSLLAGKNVHAARTQMGRQLAEEYPVDADLVIATPESGTPAAVG